MSEESTYDNDVRRAVAVMRDGGVIAYPTDTVWGIGCDASCSEAVRRVFEIKRRADSKALITLVSDEDMLARYLADRVSDVCRDIIADSSRPVTVVYPGGVNVAPELLAADGSIGIRIVRTGFASDLCRQSGGAIVSTSANISGQPAAAVYSEISEEILGAVDYVAHTGREGVPPSRPSK
ncbi:MAG: L-threonylcarbamoyladenylate synthase, partial [Duncaniella sp.]|nr:L-threonylcarbamoyladenylate synthase [Duncaniella sp.]